MSLLNFNFVMLYIIHKILVLLQNHLNYLKDDIFECFFKKYNRLLIFFKKIIFFITNNDGKSKALRRKNNKDIGNLFRLKKELNYTAVKDIRNLFR